MLLHASNSSAGLVSFLYLSSESSHLIRITHRIRITHPLSITHCCTLFCSASHTLTLRGVSERPIARDVCGNSDTPRERHKQRTCVCAWHSLKGTRRERDIAEKRRERHQQRSAERENQQRTCVCAWHSLKGTRREGHQRRSAERET